MDKHSKTLLSDVCEAVIAALYLDAGSADERIFASNRDVKENAETIGIMEKLQKRQLHLPKERRYILARIVI